MYTAPKKRAAIYMRVSTDQQDVESQLNDLKDKIKEDNVTLINKYIFKDVISGLKNDKERRDLPKLLQLTKNDIDIVYIWEISRLSRNPLYFDELLLHFKRENINICFLKPTPLYLFDLESGLEEISTGIALSIFSKYALYEIQQKNQRQKRGKIYSVLEKEQSYTYKPPYGYKSINKILVVNEDIISDITGFKSESEVVKSIFELYASGKSLTQIQKILNENKLKTKSATYLKKDQLKLNDDVSIDKDKIKWSKRSVNAILKNTVYCGYKEISYHERDKEGNITNTKVFNINTPNIISNELFLKVQQQLKDNITIANKSYKNEFLVRGLLFCGTCNSTYVGNGSKGRNYYVCSDRIKKTPNTKKGCNNSSSVMKLWIILSGIQ
jgi:site-specific DNA recombinase